MCKIQMTRGDRVLLGISADDIGLIDLCTKTRHRLLAGPWVCKTPRPRLDGTEFCSQRDIHRQPACVFQGPHRSTLQDVVP